MEYNEYDISDECPWMFAVIYFKPWRFRVNYPAGVNMRSYATYHWLSIKQRQAGGERKRVLVEADVRGGEMRDEPKERLCRAISKKYGPLQ